MTAAVLDDIIARVSTLDAPDQRTFVEGTHDLVDQVWVPNPGPQTDAYHCEADELGYGGEAGGGKHLDINTVLPTPFGWTTMGEVDVGEMVIDRNGAPCHVVAKSEVETRKTFRLTFSDGSEVVAGDTHQWITSTLRERSRGLTGTDEWRAKRRAERVRRGTGKRNDLAERNQKSARASGLPLEDIRTTGEIAETLVANKRTNHSISMAAPIRLPASNLLIDPYVLGAWLGDGTAKAGAIAGIDEEILVAVGDHYEVTHHANAITHGVLGLQAHLKAAGVYGNKHIPPAYLRASHEQRLALLQGLMDTDGHCDSRGQCEFTQVKRRLIDDVSELLHTLGIKHAVRVGEAKLGGRVIGPNYKIKFLTRLPAFRLSRKLIRQKRAGFRGTHDRRFIVSCEEIKPRPLQCIQVDSPDRTYLCGRSMVPTHNSDLLVGLSLTEHWRSLILRRTNKEAGKIVDRHLEIVQHRYGLNTTKGSWAMPNGRLVDYGGCQNESDKQKYKGDPHDLIGFDEVVDFSESQYDFISTWNRSTRRGQRCRVVATFNPPTEPTGMWVVRRWGPWLDEHHPNPAKDGEIRWFAKVGDDEHEVDGPGPHDINGTIVRARSRTFIRARLSDNPDLNLNDDYATHLANLPKGLREAFAEGKFSASLRDRPMQLIPTQWVRLAMARRKSQIRPATPMCCLGVDASGGGSDPMVISPRYDGWFEDLVSIPGDSIPPESAGAFCTGQIIALRRDRAIVNVDCGGGYGNSTFERLRENGVDARAHKGSYASTRKIKTGTYGFANMRMEVYWRLREALDPEQDRGSHVALPESLELLADLTAPTFKATGHVFALEPKESVVERLGRSTNEGDAITLSWAAGPTHVTHGSQWFSSAEQGITVGFGQMQRRANNGPRTVRGR